MKSYKCVKCGSEDLFIDERETQKALVCGDCGKWQKWIGKDELVLVKRFIESKNSCKKSK
jgi:DNA-directed RNA polymerase subunit RPC12/RpoP